MNKNKDAVIEGVLKKKKRKIIRDIQTLNIKTNSGKYHKRKEIRTALDRLAGCWANRCRVLFCFRGDCGIGHLAAKWPQGFRVI